MTRRDRLVQHAQKADANRARIYEIEREMTTLRYKIYHFDEDSVATVTYEHIFFEDQTEAEWRAAYEALERLAAEQNRLTIEYETVYSDASFLRVATETRFFDIDQPEVYIAIASIAIVSVLAYYIYNEFIAVKEVVEPEDIVDVCLICADEGVGSCWTPFFLLTTGFTTGSIYAFLELRLF